MCVSGGLGGEGGGGEGCRGYMLHRMTMSTTKAKDANALNQT